jgi:hypothetical protein
VIDRKGFRVIRKDDLDPSGEVPRVYREYLHKNHDLSDLMDEIERENTVDIDLTEFIKKDSPVRNSPVNPMMEDTPSNYNIPNQRYMT